MTVDGSRDSIDTIKATALFQPVEVVFPNGYVIMVGVQARHGDIASVYVQTPEGVAHLATVTEKQMDDLIHRDVIG
jgi:hypothetical protein